MSEDFTGTLIKYIEDSAEKYHAVITILKEIEKEEDLDLSQVIKHIEIVKSNLNDALKEITNYQLLAISRLEKKYNTLPQNIQKSNPFKSFWRIFKK